MAQILKLMRYDENYSMLKDSAGTFYNKIKYIPLSQEDPVYISFEGEVRQEVDYAVNEDWGTTSLGKSLARETFLPSGVSSEIGYLFENIQGTPAPKLGSDIISGDKRIGDVYLGTPNALYPNGGYFGMNPQVGPANLISIHPNLTYSPQKQEKLTIDVVFNWRYSTEDGIYRPSGLLIKTAYSFQKME